MKKILFTLFAVVPLLLQANDSLKLPELLSDKGLYSVIVTKNDQTIFKQFYQGKTENDLIEVKSITKSIMSLLIGIALDKKFLQSLDQPLTDFFPELLTDTSAAKKRITIRHVLNHASGLADYEEWPSQMQIWLNSPNPSAFLLSQPLVSEPGKEYRYNSPATHLLSAIVTKASKMETADFAQQYLFKPLGIKSYKWDILRDGFYDGAGISLALRTTDLAKIGNLIVQKGTINKTSVISYSYIKILCDLSLKRETPWGLPDSKVGLCWYQTRYEGEVVNYCLGYGGQFLIVFPYRKCVIAVNHNIAVQDPDLQSYNFVKNYLPVIYKAMIEAGE
ncbi:serine hydrolase domain-containing protein [Cytophaga aurantiaca]|uniref:serine hydrolase domain-containing protein n=1 Tax=Cytophaga aurantiaca TaxID=29530 RepID=UPI000381DF05|nr:serine hydrolase [Cytophaga aurantiaca]